MICRQFDFNKALPSSLTEVYNEAVLAMLHQSATRNGGSSPSSLLDELSLPRLHQAVVSLCKLAYEALSKKSCGDQTVCVGDSRLPRRRGAARLFVGVARCQRR